MIGGITGTVDHNYSAVGLSENMRLVEAKLVICDQATQAKASKAADMAGVPYGAVTFEEIDAQLAGDEISAAAPKRYTPDQLPVTPAYLYFTSGTTGNKKAVTISQRNMVGTMCFTEWFPRTNMPALVYTEFHHSSQLVITMHIAIKFKSPHYILNAGENVDVRQLCEVIQKYKITGTLMQP